MKKQLCAIMSAVLLGAIALFPSSVTSTPSVLITNTIYVDDDNTGGPWDGTFAHPFQYIQDGIDAASNNDTIFIFNGTYSEQIVVNKSLYLLGEHRKYTIIDGMNNGAVICIQYDNVVIQNLSVRNSGGYSGDAGILIEAANCTISHSFIYRTKTGISLQGNGNEINNCTLFTNGEGILLNSSEDTKITGCSLYHNAIGVHSERSSTITISFSYLHTNGLAGLFNDSLHGFFKHCNISDNSDNHGGLLFRNCEEMTISHCMFRHNGMGINVANSQFISVDKCTFMLNTHFAVLLKQESTNITISQCEILRQFRFGMYVVENSVCTLEECNIEDNMLYGLYTKNAACIAQNNWWGFIIGPSFTEFRKTERISLNPGVRFIPWALEPFDDVGSDWNENEAYMDNNVVIQTIKIIDLPGIDTDDDGVPDWWEEKYGYDPETWDNHTNLDPDEDGLNNIEECFTDQWGSDPFQKDIFVEIDWMESRSDPDASNKPSNVLIGRLIDIFASHSIALHVDIGGLGEGEEIPYSSNFSFANLRDLYWDYFLHNDLNNPRKGIFHYGLVCDYGPDVNFPFVGWDHLDSFLISAQWMQDLMPYYIRGRLIVGGAVHQLGSSLGLLADTHGGNDNLVAMIPFTLQWLKYRNYKSCMNYYWKYKLFSYSDGSHGPGDFDDWEYLNLSFFKDSQFTWPKP